MRSGWVCRSMRIRVLRVRTSTAEMTGSVTRSTPKRVRSRKPKMTPASTRTVPEPMKARPLVVRTLRSERMRVCPCSAGCGRHRHLAQQVGDHLGGGAACELGLARGHEAVREDRASQYLH